MVKDPTPSQEGSGDCRVAGPELPGAHSRICCNKGSFRTDTAVPYQVPGATAHSTLHLQQRYVNPHTYVRVRINGGLNSCCILSCDYKLFLPDLSQQNRPQKGRNVTNTGQFVEGVSLHLVKFFQLVTGLIDKGTA